MGTRIPTPHAVRAETSEVISEAEQRADIAGVNALRRGPD